MVLWLVWSAALLLGAYLLGSIATGYWLGYALKGIDIRQHGSGSTGATNVLRTLGKGPAIAVLLIDMLKGLLAVLLIGPGLVWASERFLPAGVVDFALWSDWLRALAGLAALIGHSKSPWIGFTGGKSVASSLGVLLALHWPVALGTLGVFAAVLSLSQIVSLSSIVGAIAVTVFMIACALSAICDRGRGLRDRASPDQHPAPSGRHRTPHRPKILPRPDLGPLQGGRSPQKFLARVGATVETALLVAAVQAGPVPPAPNRSFSHPGTLKFSTHESML